MGVGSYWCDEMAREAFRQEVPVSALALCEGSDPYEVYVVGGWPHVGTTSTAFLLDEAFQPPQVFVRLLDRFEGFDD